MHRRGCGIEKPRGRRGCGKGGSPRTLNVMQTGSVRKDHKGESGGHGPTTEAPKYIVQEAPLHQLHVHFITGVRAGVRLVSEQDQEGRLCSCRGRGRGCNAPGPAWPARRQHCTQQPARLCWGTEPRAGHAAPLAVAGAGRAPTECHRERDLAEHAATSLRFTDRKTKARDVAGPRPRPPGQGEVPDSPSCGFPAPVIAPVR